MLAQHHLQYTFCVYLVYTPTGITPTVTHPLVRNTKTPIVLMSISRDSPRGKTARNTAQTCFRHLMVALLRAPAEFRERPYTARVPPKEGPPAFLHWKQRPEGTRPITGNPQPHHLAFQVQVLMVLGWHLPHSVHIVFQVVAVFLALPPSLPPQAWLLSYLCLCEYVSIFCVRAVTVLFSLPCAHTVVDNVQGFFCCQIFSSWILQI